MCSSSSNKYVLRLAINNLIEEINHAVSVYRKQYGCYPKIMFLGSEDIKTLENGLEPLMELYYSPASVSTVVAQFKKNQFYGMEVYCCNHCPNQVGMRVEVVVDEITITTT